MKTADIAVTLVDHMGSDLSVVNAARVSFDKISEWEYTEVWGVDEQGDYTELQKALKGSDVNLIRYLARHKHFSPFNHTYLTFRIKAPIYVARQLVKHEYMPWNEVSRRYVDSEPEFFIPATLHKRADNVKQGSADEAASEEAMQHLRAATAAALWRYDQLLRLGVAPEEARIVLPHNLMTEWIWSGTLKAFHKMLTLRLDSHAQRHTRDVAELILPEIKKLFPISIEALLGN